MGIWWSNKGKETPNGVDDGAFAQSPAWMNKKEVDYSEHQPQNQYGAFTLPALATNWIDIKSYSERSNAIMENSIAKTCVLHRAKAIGNIDIKYEGDNPAVKLLLDSPNAREGTIQTFLTNGEHVLSIGGDLWLFWDKRTKNRPTLHTFRPDLMKHDPKAKTYSYNPSGNKPEYVFTYDHLGKTIKAEVLNGSKYEQFDGGLQRVSYFDPRTSSNGAGAGDSALRAIKIISAIDDLLAGKFNAGGAKNGFFEIPATLTDDEAARLQAKLSLLNPNGTHVLPSGMKFNDSQLTLAEMEVLEAYDKMAKLICTAFQVPNELVFATGTTYANMRGADKIFYRNFIGPEAHWLVGQLQTGLRLYIDPKATLSVDETSVQHLEEDRLDRASKMAQMKCFTADEIRAALGYEAAPADAEFVGASVNMGQPEEKPKGEVAFNANAGNRGDNNDN